MKNTVFTTEQIISDYDSIKKNIHDFIFDTKSVIPFNTRKELPFTINDEIEETSIQIPASNLLFTIVAMKCFKDANVVPELDDFFTDSSMDADKFEKYFNRIITIFYEMEEDLKRLSVSISESIAELSSLAAKTNMAVGNTICLFDLIQEANTSEEFNDLINTNIPSGLQFNEIEDFVSQRKDAIVKYLSKADTCFRDMINCRGAINQNQLGQSIVSIGLKPNLEGAIIPDPINTSFLRGLRNRSDFFVDAQGGRKALIVNYKNVRSSGYLTRKLSLLVMDQYSTKKACCDTKHFLSVHVTDEKVLKRIHNRFDKDGVLITSESTHLIGQHVEIRTPVTCTSKHENGARGVCNTCYGRLAEPNEDFHWGIIAVLFLTSKLTQNLLSSKHLLQTKSEKINWSEQFSQFFSVDRAGVISEVELKNITFSRDDVKEDDDGDLFMTSLTVNGTKIEAEKELYLNEDFVNEYRSTLSDEIVMTNIPHDTEVFSIKMNNLEISASLNKILKLIGSDDHLGMENNINDVYNEFISLLNQSNLSIQSVHIEMILRALVRKEEDNSLFPDFSFANYPDIAVLGVSKAIFNAPMLSVGLSFEHLKKQLISPSTFQKTKRSIFDNLYI